jgi:Flp pilus assembly protein protease CpaA
MLRLLSIFPLTVMMVSDARSRTVSSWWLSAFGLVLVVAGVVEEGWRVTLINIVCNLFVLLVIGVSLLAYSKMRKRPLMEMLGIGDVIFLAVLTSAFGVEVYLRFLIVSAILALLSCPLFRRMQPVLTGIPLVTVFGVCFIIFILFRVFYGAWWI